MAKKKPDPMPQVLYVSRDYDPNDPEVVYMRANADPTYHAELGQSVEAFEYTLVRKVRISTITTIVE